MACARLCCATKRAQQAEIHAATPMLCCRHPEYEPDTFCNDIALLELNKTAAVARPIAGVLQPGQFSYPPGHPLTVLGWGNTGVSDPLINSTNPFPDTLRYVDLPLIPHDECDVASAFNGRVFAPSMLCAGKQVGRVPTAD